MALNLSEIRKRLESIRGLAHDSILELYSQLENKEITLEEWEARMYDLITEYTLASYMSGYDSDTLPESAIDKINNHVTEQTNFLGQFASAIGIGLTGAAMSPMLPSSPEDHLKWNAWRGRALSYIGGLTQPFWEGVADSYKPGGTPPKTVLPWEDPDIQQSLPLPALPGDGSTLCGQWCRCEWKIDTLNEDAGDYDCYWIMDKDAEHCQTCVERANRWSPLKIRNWEIVADDVEIATKEEQESVIKAIVMKKLKEKIAEKGGKGSGNWGHQGLSGVWGGSSPTKGNVYSSTGDVINLDEERFPGLANMPLMQAEPSEYLKEKAKQIEFDPDPNRGKIYLGNYEERHIHQLGVTQAVDNMIKEKTGFSALEDVRRVNLADSHVEMRLGRLLVEPQSETEIDWEDESWETISKANENPIVIRSGSMVSGYVNSESLDLTLREFGEDHLVHSGGIEDVPHVTIRAEHLIAHELGHILYYGKMKNMVVKRKFGEDRDGNVLYYKTTPLEIWKDYWEYNTWFDRHTNYSKQSASEGFAETFVSYLFNVTPATNLENLPESFQLIEEMFRIMREGGMTEKGGPGSGNWGHSGLEGMWGGSSPTKGSMKVEVDVRFEGLGDIKIHKDPTYDDSFDIARRTWKINLKKSGDNVTGKFDALHYQSQLGFPGLTKDEKIELGYYQGCLDFVRERTGLDLSDTITFIPTNNDEEYAMAQAMIYSNGQRIVSKHGMETTISKEKFSEYVKSIQRGELACMISLHGKSGYMKSYLVAKDVDDDGFFRKEGIVRTFETDFEGNTTAGQYYQVIKVHAHQILMHELGHAVYNRWESRFSEWKKTWNEDKNFDRHTAYGMTNAEEGFAESFVSYVYNLAGERNLSSNDKTMRMIDRIIKDIANE